MVNSTDNSADKKRMHIVQPCASIVAKYRAGEKNGSFIQSERIQSLLFAVLVARRFHELRQTQEPTVSDRLSVSADICWIIGISVKAVR